MYRCDQRNVRQMCATAKGIVQHYHIPWLHRARVNCSPHRHRHRSQMHRHVIAHCNHLACTVENRAGVVAPLFDIGRKCRAPQGCAHLFCNGVIQVPENFQFDGITPHEAQCTTSRSSLVVCELRSSDVCFRFCERLTTQGQRPRREEICENCKIVLTVY
jgi:hypothetical protein